METTIHPAIEGAYARVQAINTGRHGYAGGDAPGNLEAFGAFLAAVSEHAPLYTHIASMAHRRAEMALRCAELIGRDSNALASARAHTFEAIEQAARVMLYLRHSL